MTSVGLLEAQPPARRAIAYDDLAPAVHTWMQREHPGTARDAASFDAYVRRLEQHDRERRAEGEGEHLVYFVLQSTQFTGEMPIEPALSARAFFGRLTVDERRRLLADRSYVPPADRIPADAARRLHAFLDARSNTPADARLGLLSQVARDRTEPSPFSRLCADYARAMRFLYQKEFPRESEAPALASVYQERGFSTDTAFEANYAVYLALGVLQGVAADERLNRILIVGPGLDVAPRTGFVDRFPPQSHQPFAVADALLALGLADAAHLTVHAIDINDDVVRYLERVRRLEIADLSVLSTIGPPQAAALTDGYREYFRNFGSRIGKPPVQAPPAGFEGHLFKSIRLDESLASRVSADRLDIVTERYTSAPGYDLVVVTNVFTYFGDGELALALANIGSMLRPGGYLVHNETRPVLPVVADAQGLSTIHSRSLLIAPSLYDTVWIHRKKTVNKSVGVTP